MSATFPERPLAKLGITSKIRKIISGMKPRSNGWTARVTMSNTCSSISQVSPKFGLKSSLFDPRVGLILTCPDFRAMSR